MKKTAVKAKTVKESAMKAPTKKAPAAKAPTTKVPTTKSPTTIPPSPPAHPPPSPHLENRPKNVRPKRSRPARIERILNALDKEYGTEYRCYLNHETPWQLLIAVIMSAQCTDARVNIVTADLFKKYDTLEKFAARRP